jgi:hypothetical protein
MTKYEVPMTKYEVPMTKYEVPMTKYEVPMTKYFAWVWCPAFAGMVMAFQVQP